MSFSVIYPGTFDPITRGHQDIIERAARLFERVVVAVAEHTTKSVFFSLPERLLLAQQTLAHLPNVKVEAFQGLLVNFAARQNIPLILRGIRAMADFEYERQLSGMTQKIAPETETIFLASNALFSHISSSFVRDIARLGGEVSAFVSPEVAKALHQKLFKGA